MIYSGVLVNISSSVKTVINHFLLLFAPRASAANKLYQTEAAEARGKLMRSEREFFFSLKLFNLMKYRKILKTTLR